MIARFASSSPIALVFRCPASAAVSSFPTLPNSILQWGKCRTTCRSAGSLPLPSPPPPLEPWRHSSEPVERAATPPSSWYTQPAVLQLEERNVFRTSWLAVVHASQLTAPGAYAAGSVLGLQWLACRDQQGRLRAFHNVCRHHAAILAAPGTGTAEAFRCGYHGWTYGLDGRLLRATRLRGIQDFRAGDNGLAPLQAEVWGGFVWVRQAAAPACTARAAGPEHQQAANAGPEAAAAPDCSPSGNVQQTCAQQQHHSPTYPQEQHEQGVAAWLGAEGSAAALAAGIADPLVHVASREYVLQCNWKVFVDNYLDGGYHVSVAHPELASGLDLTTYRSYIYKRLSIQTCQPEKEAVDGAMQAEEATPAAAAVAAGAPAGDAEGQRGGFGNAVGQRHSGSRGRLAGGRPPAYVWIYPNIMLNRYGPWLDVNTVTPLTADTCKVAFDYYLEPGRAGNAADVAASLAASDRVQQEDIALCESVQKGLASPGYDVGRYAPSVEAPMHHFHRLLHADLAAA